MNALLPTNPAIPSSFLHVWNSDELRIALAKVGQAQELDKKVVIFINTQ